MWVQRPRVKGVVVQWDFEFGNTRNAVSWKFHSEKAKYIVRL